MTFRNLRVEDRNRTRWITFHRPERLNALNAETMDEFRAAFLQALEEEAVRVIVLTGAGEKAFIAGADIQELAQLTGPGSYPYTRRGQEVLNLVEQSPKPVLAAINGYALGGGFELALATHIRFAARTAKLGLPEINLAIIPGWGGTQRLVRIVGPGKALEIALSGEFLSAEEAYRLGIVNRVFEPDQLVEETQKFADLLSEKPPVAVRAILDDVYAGQDQDLYESLKYTAALFAVCRSTEDSEEGLRAFLEKRKPTWKGR